MKIVSTLVTAVLTVSVTSIAHGQIAKHGPEMKKAHHVAINSVTKGSGDLDDVYVVKATLTYADGSKAKCTYRMTATVQKDDLGAGVWLAPFPDAEKCVPIR